MSSTSTLDSTKAGVGKPKKSGAEQRQERKRKRDEIEQRLQKEADREKQNAIQEELNQFDKMDETWEQLGGSRSDADLKDVKLEPTADGRPSTSISEATGQNPPEGTVGTSPKEGSSNSNANGAPLENGDTPMGSVEGGPSELPTDLNSEPLLSSFSSMSIQDNGIPIESVARRSKFEQNQRVTRDFINMHGPKYCARYTIDPVPYLPDGKRMEQLHDVSNPMTRHIDHPVLRRTWAQLEGISAVAWQYEPGLSKEARLALLDPVKVKMTNKYSTIKKRNKAIKDEHLRLPTYPPGHIRVVWKDKSSSWETASAVRGLYAKNTVKIEEEIYKSACQQENNHEKWLNKERPDRDRSPTFEPSGLRDETPEADAVQPTQPHAAEAFGKPSPSPEPNSATGTPTPALAQDTAQQLQAFAARYKKARGMDPSTLLSDKDRSDCMMEFQNYETLRLQAATVVF